MVGLRASRVTTKGQVTIPSSIRSALGVKPGDLVEFESSGDFATIRVRRSRLMEFYGIARQQGVPMTDEEMEDAFEIGVATEAIESMKQGG